LLAPLVMAITLNLPEDVTVTTPVGPVTPVEQLLKFLEELTPHLEARKPKKCAEVLAINHTLVWPPDLQQDAAALEQATTKYKFKEALELVRSLKVRLTEGKP
jgi:two-component system sensor histidine kinase/response regulator